MRKWLFLGAFFGLTAVGAGAYGWHTLEGDSALREIFNLGVEYQMWHALALLAVAWLSTQSEGRAAKAVTVAGWAFAIGIVTFSGTLYYFSMTEEIFLAGLAPAGGILLVLGWGALMWSALARK